MLIVELNIEHVERSAECRLSSSASAPAHESKGSDEHAHPHSLARAFPSPTSKIDLVADVE